MAASAPVIPVKTKRSMASRYNKGASLNAVADEFGIPAARVKSTLVDEGVTIRGRGRPKGSTNAPKAEAPEEGADD